MAAGAALRYPPESRLDVDETTNVVAGGALAELLGADAGCAWVRVRRAAWARPPICRTDVYLLPKYAEIARDGRSRKTPMIAGAAFPDCTEEVAVERKLASTPADATAVSRNWQPGYWQFVAIDEHGEFRNLGLRPSR